MREELDLPTNWFKGMFNASVPVSLTVSPDPIIQKQMTAADKMYDMAHDSHRNWRGTSEKCAPFAERNISMYIWVWHLMSFLSLRVWPDIHQSDLE